MIPGLAQFPPIYGSIPPAVPRALLDQNLLDLLDQSNAALIESGLVADWEVGSSYAQIAGSWTNLQYLINPTYGSGYAQTVMSSVGTNTARVYNFGLSSAVIPDDAVIDRVDLKFYADRDGQNLYATDLCCVRVIVGSTQLTRHNEAPSTPTEYTYDITAERAWTPADFRDVTLVAEVSAVFGSGNHHNKSVTFKFGAPKLRVIWH